MDNENNRVLVIGAGIAGLTAATALAQKGWQVDLIERKPQIDDGGGVGLTLVGNALRALDRIGVAQDCVDHGVAYNSMAIRNQAGDLVMDNPLPRIGGDTWPSCASITRAKLHAILLEAATPLCQIKCGVVVRDWEHFDNHINVTFSDELSESYYFIVSAEGIYSNTRKKLMPDINPAPTGQVVWRVGLDRPKSIDRTNLYPMGPLGVVGVCPVSEETCYLYIVENDDESFRDPETLDAQMRALLADYGGIVSELSTEIQDPKAVNFRPLEWLLAPRPYGSGRIIMIGDSIHAGPPVIAQGAAMGIEDAIVLADSMTKYRGSFQSGLTDFLDRREARNAHVVENSCKLARWEVEGATDKDVVGVMRESSEMLAQAI